MKIVPEILSPNGFLVEDSQGPIAVCWVYFTFDCPRASIDDVYARPDADAVALVQAWRSLDRACSDFIRSRGYPVVSTFADEKLASILKREGWIVSTKPHVHVLKVL